MFSPIFIIIGVGLVGFTIVKVEHTYSDSEVFVLLFSGAQTFSKRSFFFFISFYPLMSLEYEIIKVKHEQI